jgi:hypothetical protein
MTEAKQHVNYLSYFERIRHLESIGVKLGVLFPHTLDDGQGGGTDRELVMGLRRFDGTKKAAWYDVRDFANELVPA